jgi:RNA polymerase sigma-70 factor (ECF subfamily)
MAVSERHSTTTKELLRLVEQGSREALEELLARYRQSLRRFIDRRMERKLRGRVDPSDVVQETQLEVFRRFADFLARRPMPFLPWLFRTAHECLLKTRRHHVGARKRAVYREVSLSEGSLIFLRPQRSRNVSTPDQRLDDEDALRLVRHALNKMSELDRGIVWMRSLRGLTNQQVAQNLRIGPTAASQRFARALLRLRAMLATVEA